MPRGLTVLVVGSGGREHALAWALQSSPSVEHLLVAPGNGGTAAIAENVPIAATDIPGLVALARERQVDLTVVGPEEPLARGLVDAFAAAGLTAFGPTAEAARIEASKAWAKDVMRAAGVPTAEAQVVTDFAAAQAALERLDFPLVIKASGLAAGKGAIVVSSRREAEEVLHWMMVQRALGSAADEVLLEEYLEGRELSFLVVTDGTTVLPLLPARDYKRLGDNDTGPNTGGMGAYAPVPEVTDELQRTILERIIHPTLAELRRRGIVYRGVLYAGLMLTPRGPKVLEFNCRFGDPETQAILPLLETDLATLLLSAARAEALWYLVARLEASSLRDGRCCLRWLPRYLCDRISDRWPGYRPERCIDLPRGNQTSERSRRDSRRPCTRCECHRLDIRRSARARLSRDRAPLLPWNDVPPRHRARRRGRELQADAAERDGVIATHPCRTAARMTSTRS
jgi:phosphoribosylamine--glycine ligase